MALTYDQITGITKRYFLPKLADNIFLGNPALRRFKEKAYKKIDGGEKILIPLEYAELANSAWFQGADTLDTTDNDSFTAAAIDWKQVHATISITRRDELRNMGDAQVVDFVKSKVKNAEKTLKKKLSVGIYSDGTTDPKSIVGLRAWVAVSGSPGGIDAGANSWWQGQVDSTTTTLSISALQTLFNQASEDDEAPSVALATKANYNRYYNLLQPQQRFTDSESGKAGFTSLMFNSIPLLSDTNCPANNLFLINENYINLCVHSKEDMRMSDFVEPVNQAVKVSHIYWMGGFASSNNRFHGRFSGLTA